MNTAAYDERADHAQEGREDRLREDFADWAHDKYDIPHKLLNTINEEADGLIVFLTEQWESEK